MKAWEIGIFDAGYVPLMCMKTRSNIVIVPEYALHLLNHFLVYKYYLI